MQIPCRKKTSFCTQGHKPSKLVRTPKDLTEKLRRRRKKAHRSENGGLWEGRTRKASAYPEAEGEAAKRSFGGEREAEWVPRGFALVFANG